MDAIGNSNSPEIGSVEEVDGYGDVLAQATKPTPGYPELTGIQDCTSDNEYVLLQTQASFDSRRPPLGSVQNVATSLSSLDQLGQKHGPGSFSRGCLVRFSDDLQSQQLRSIATVCSVLKGDEIRP